MDGLWVNMANAAENGARVRPLSDIDRTLYVGLTGEMRAKTGELLFPLMLSMFLNLNKKPDTSTHEPLLWQIGGEPYKLRLTRRISHRQAHAFKSQEPLTALHMPARRCSSPPCGVS